MKKIKCSSSFPRVLSKEAYIAHLLRRSWRYRTVGDRIVEGKDNMRIRREIFWETMEIDHAIILMLLRIYHRDAYSFLVFIFILKIESRALPRVCCSPLGPVSLATSRMDRISGREERGCCFASFPSLFTGYFIYFPRPFLLLQLTMRFDSSQLCVLAI